MSPLDRANVQAIVLDPYPYPISRHFLFTIGQRDGGRRFLAEWMPKVTHGAHPNLSNGGDLINVGVSWNGLLALGAFDAMGGEVPANAAFYIFNEAPDAESLRAFGSSAPAEWWNRRFASADIHLIIHVYVTSEAALDTVTTALRASAQGHGLRELVASDDGEPITGRLIEGRRLHFGYEDGISHPAVNWDDTPDRPDLLPRGAFLLGYPAKSLSTYPDAAPFSDFVRDGSLVAFMMMYQDVASFQSFLKVEGPKAAPHLAQVDAEEYLAARLMGRWRDGTPLALSPEAPDPALAMADDFGYADDPAGLKCPLAAHIRIANARDQPLNAVNTTIFPDGFPRVLRRGSPYGPPLHGDADDGVDRGVVGMFLCANLNKQVYPLTRWLSRTDFSPVYPDQVGQDPIVGNRAFPGASARFSFQAGGEMRTIDSVADFVMLRGVAFTLLPSLAALRRLAA